MCGSDGGGLGPAFSVDQPQDNDDDDEEDENAGAVRGSSLYDLCGADNF